MDICLFGYVLCLAIGAILESSALSLPTPNLPNSICKIPCNCMPVETQQSPGQQLIYAVDIPLIREFHIILIHNVHKFQT